MALKYKIGDRVRIKSIDWYNENKDKVGNILYKRDGSAYPVFFSKYMSNFCGEILTIKSVFKHSYHMNETSSCEFWTDEMIEGLVEEETKPNIIEEAKTYWDSIKDAWICPDGYIFKDQDGNVINATKIVLEKKKKEYPKSYEECCRILGIDVRDLDILDNMLDTSETIYRKNLDRLLNSFRKLLMCRDAYWKIAGEEMGLGKPWKPNDSSGYCTYAILRHTGHIRKSRPYADSELLEFPTEEMRDAFYENFKKEIEICKELL